MNSAVGRSLSPSRASSQSKPLVAQRAVALARHQRVERDQAHRQVLDRVLQEAALGQVGVIGEGLAHGVARIVVAGDEIDRHRQGREQPAQQRVFLGLAAVDQVARGEDDVGLRVERHDMRHRALEEARRVDALVQKLARRLDVHVGDLRDAALVGLMHFTNSLETPLHDADSAARG